MISDGEFSLHEKEYVKVLTLKIFQQLITNCTMHEIYLQFTPHLTYFTIVIECPQNFRSTCPNPSWYLKVICENNGLKFGA